MKKILCIIGLIFLLSACGVKENNSKDTSNNIEILTTRNGFNQVQVTEDGIYYTENYVLNFYDFASGVHTPLCSSSACKHNDETCTAKLECSLASILLNKNKDKLLYTYFDAETRKNNTVIQELDGTNKKTIDKREGLPDSFMFIAGDNDNIYIISAEASDMFTSKNIELVRINCTTGKSESLYKFDSGMAKLIGAYGRNIIAQLIEYNQETMSIDYKILEINVDNKVSEILDTYTHSLIDDSVTNDMIFVDKSNLYKFQDAHDGVASLYKTDLLTGERKLISDNVPYFGGGDGTTVQLCFLDNVIIDVMQFKRKGAAEDKMGRYVINLNDGTYKQVYLNMQREHPEEGIFDPIQVLKHYDDFLIVSYGMDFTDYVFLGQTAPSKIGVGRYGIISVEDFLNSVPNYKKIRYLDQ